MDPSSSLQAPAPSMSRKRSRKFPVGEAYLRRMSTEELRSYFHSGKWAHEENKPGESLQQTEARLFGARPYAFLNSTENESLGRTTINNKRSRGLEETGEVEPRATESRKEPERPRVVRPKSQFGRTELVDDKQRCYRRENTDYLAFALKPGQDAPSPGDILSMRAYMGRSLSMAVARNSVGSGPVQRYIVETVLQRPRSNVGLVKLAPLDASVPLSYQAFVAAIEAGLLGDFQLPL